MYLLESLADEDKWIIDYFEGRLTGQDIADHRTRFEEICENTGTILYGSVMSRLHFNRFEELLGTLQESIGWEYRFLQILNQEIA
ncbi:hypothetical protein D3C78_1850820 [compost metagenome]